MKIGNLSQSIVPVPNFFLNKERNIETFHISRRRRYYKEKDLFQIASDINLNNNHRNNQRITEQFNKTKYIPPYSFKTKSMPSSYHTTESNEYTKMMNFMKESDVLSNRNPELREEIKANVRNLLDRINSDYDLKRWDEFNTKTTSKLFQTEHPLDKQISIKDDETDQFTKTIQKKIESLTSIPKETKDKLIKNKLCLPIVNKNKIKSHTAMCSMYNKNELEYSPSDMKLIEENKYVRERFNNTTLYKDFPSPTRVEFDRKIIKKRRSVKTNVVESDISKAKYNFTEKDLFNCTSEMFSRPLHKDHFK